MALNPSNNSNLEQLALKGLTSWGMSPTAQLNLMHLRTKMKLLDFEVKGNDQAKWTKYTFGAVVTIDIK